MEAAGSRQLAGRPAGPNVASHMGLTPRHFIAPNGNDGHIGTSFKVGRVEAELGVAVLVCAKTGSASGATDFI